jgi:hypothetical protein
VTKKPVRTARDRDCDTGQRERGDGTPVERMIREQVRFLEKAAKLRAKGERGVTLSGSAGMLGQWVELLANDPDFTVYVDPPSTRRQGRGGSWMDGG